VSYSSVEHHALWIVGQLTQVGAILNIVALEKEFALSPSISILLAYTSQTLLI
jgi:hypothetical protein